MTLALTLAGALLVALVLAAQLVGSSRPVNRPTKESK